MEKDSRGKNNQCFIVLIRYNKLGARMIESYNLTCFNLWDVCVCVYIERDTINVYTTKVKERL